MFRLQLTKTQCPKGPHRSTNILVLQKEKGGPNKWSDLPTQLVSNGSKWESRSLGSWSQVVSKSPYSSARNRRLTPWLLPPKVSKYKQPETHIRSWPEACPGSYSSGSEAWQLWAVGYATPERRTKQIFQISYHHVQTRDFVLGHSDFCFVFTNDTSRLFSNTILFKALWEESGRKSLEKLHLLSFSETH